MGASVLPRLPLHGGDRNRTSPFAFTGNKFEFRALGSSMSLGMPNTILNTIVAEAIDDARRQARRRRPPAAPRSRRACSTSSRTTWTENKRIVFSGDNYSDEWHAEAEAARAGQPRARRPDALPWLIEPSTVEVFGKYEVLSERELHSRYEVAVEQYITTINIEAETAASIARTMLLPAAIRWLGTLKEVGIARKLVEETAALVDEFVERDLRARGRQPADHPEDDDGLDGAKYVQTTVIPRDGRRPRGRRQARADRAGRPLAAPEVLGDPLHQVGLHLGYMQGER